MTNIKRIGGKILVDEGFKFLLGVNYWPRKLNIRMWRDWDDSAIREDLNLMKNIGIRAVRFFIKNEDFADENANVFPHALEKLGRFLDLLREHNIMGFATLIVGHMSGKNWEIPWLRPEEIYTSHGIERTMRFIETIVTRFSAHPAIAGWILSNELSLVRRAEKREEALALLRLYSKIVSSIARSALVSSGDLVDSYMQEPPNVSSLVDYIGLHLYLHDSDPVRHGYTYGAIIELFSNDNTIPVIVEEFGFSTYQYSEESHAKFINEVLYTALAHGASGAFIWCFSDFLHESDPPYEWRPLELGFGIVRKDGSLKPAAEAVKKFLATLENIEKLRINIDFIRKPQISIISPFYLFRDYEFVWYRSALGFWKIIQPVIAASIIASSSSIDNTILFELDFKPSTNKKLLIMPSVVVALSSTWRRVLEYIDMGGNAYISLMKGFGEFRAAYETATHMWGELMGIENMLEAGSYGVKHIGNIDIEFVKDLGIIRKGEKFEFYTSLPIYIYKARAIDAEVLAVDGSGNPIMFRAKRGKGYIYTMLIPVELIAALAENMDWSGKMQRLYKSIAIESDVSVTYESLSPEVEVKSFYGVESDIIIVINHGGRKTTEILSGKTIRSVSKLGGDAEIISWSDKKVTLEMPSKSAAVLHIT